MGSSRTAGPRTPRLRRLRRRSAAAQLHYCSGTTSPPAQQIAGIVQQLVNDNGSGIGTNWKAQFLNSQGIVIPTAVAIGHDLHRQQLPAVPPPGACGVSVSARPSWTAVLRRDLRHPPVPGLRLGHGRNVPKGHPIGIVALNKVGPHEILGGGTGTFVVSGTIFLNTDVTQQPWTQSAGGVEWDDAIDAKTDSNLYVYGPVDTVNRHLQR